MQRKLTPEEQQYVEDFGLFAEQIGMTRMAGRILAWLLICDPPHQTLNELTEALQASKSAVSTTARMLATFGMLERFSVPGERRDYYRLAPDLWVGALDRANQQFQGFRKMAERGLALLDGEPPERRQRLEEMYALYAFIEREYPQILEHWRQGRGAPS
ncbi:MAG: MarR family transcriptional regulator [Caldilineae bacterium]|nr:MAG: MarR family transcriptional regulator [Caldilineae bacterium]